MQIYNKDGYFEVENVLKTKLPFLYVVGGRGVGKTFSSIKFCLEHNIKFVFLRRTQTELDLINKQEFSPITPVANYLGINVLSVPLSKYNVGFYKAEVSEEGKLTPVGPCLGYSMALSTVAHIRGASYDDIDLIIYDEFIPEAHIKPIKEEAACLLNCYETINRNRELSGRPPVQLLCLANSNNASNPIFLEMKLISRVELMKKKGQIYSLDYDRGIGIFMLDNSRISREKQDTALYRATKGSEFEQMALFNEFEEFKTDLIRPMPIKEYKPVCSVGEITFYKHKADGTYYCTTMKFGDPETYGADQTDRKRWYRKYNFLWTAYMRNKIYFEDATSEIIFNKYLKL